MPEDEGLSDLRIPIDSAQTIEQICDAFEAARRKSDSVRIEDFFQEMGNLETKVLIRELLELDIYYRIQQEGIEGLRIDTYRERFPGFEDEIETAMRSAVSRAGQHDLNDTQLYFPSDIDLEPAPKDEQSVVQQLREYTVLEEIGRGGMGIVYKAIHTSLECLVAIKVLPREYADRPEAVTRFTREMKAVGKLDHANIVRATDAGQVDGIHFLVMEYIDGENLDMVVNTLGPLPLADACELIRQAALAVQHAHEHKLVHRDIKPSNLMLTRSGQVKLLDMGLARLMDDPSRTDLTKQNQVMGSVDYIAPEQVRNTRSVDIRADIYSLGCTLFKLIVGRAPFRDAAHRAPWEIMMAHVREEIPVVRELRPDTTESLELLIQKMTSKEPKDRPGTPAELVELLDSHCRGSNTVRISELAFSPSESAETVPTVQSDDVLRPPIDQQLAVEERRESKEHPNRLTAVLTLVGIAVAFVVATLMWPDRPKATDILADVDPQRDSKNGNWELVDGVLVSPASGAACLRLPTSPSPPFELKLVAERQEGLTLFLVYVNDSASFAIEFGIEVVMADTNGAKSSDDATSSKNGLFVSWGDMSNPKPRQFLIRVGDETIRVDRDGEEVLNTPWQESHRERIPDSVPKKPGVYVWTNNARYQFSKIVLQ